MNSMQVNCPQCSTRYLLPDSLLGPGGARVRCPRCREPFVVEPPAVLEAAEPLTAPEEANGLGLANGSPILAAVARATPANGEAEETPAAASTEPPAEAGETPAILPLGDGPPAPPRVDVAQTPEEVARAVLQELAAHSGEAISSSREQGRLFREFGPVIAEAYDFYRRRVGPGVSPAPFRAALRELWGVNLEAESTTPRFGGPPRL